MLVQKELPKKFHKISLSSNTSQEAASSLTTNKEYSSARNVEINSNNTFDEGEKEQDLGFQSQDFVSFQPISFSVQINNLMKTDLILISIQWT